MPGPYAHITLLHELMRPGTPGSILFPTPGILSVLESNFHYCALGAVSPDYPNLARQDGTAARWADAMHIAGVGEMIASGVRRIRGRNGEVRDKQLAWFLGYCAHVVTDVTIHPVVQARVGVYAENQRHHRLCEMNQDSYIYRRMSLGEIGEEDTFARSIARCSAADDGTRLDRDIVELWEGMLADAHPQLFAACPPDIAAWHRGFIAKATDFRAGEMRLFPLAGVIAAKIGVAYPAYGAVDRQYIEEQLIPSESPYPLHYDEIFDHAAANVAAMWRVVEQAVCTGDPVEPRLFDGWNLDSGCDKDNKPVFW